MCHRRTKGRRTKEGHISIFVTEYAISSCRGDPPPPCQCYTCLFLQYFFSYSNVNKTKGEEEAGSTDKGFFEGGWVGGAHYTPTSLNNFCLNKYYHCQSSSSKSMICVQPACVVWLAGGLGLGQPHLEVRQPRPPPRLHQTHPIRGGRGHRVCQLQVGGLLPRD